MLNAYLAGLNAFLWIVGTVAGFLTIPAALVVGLFWLDRRRKAKTESSVEVM